MNDAAPIAAASAVPVYAPGPVPAVGGKVGVLLVNLGTPDGADAASVRRYLKEFLSDPRVIENQGLVWQLALNGVILRIRPRRKARDYAKIWNQDKNESPLKTITRAQAEKLAAALAPRGPRLLVDWAMRYGNPSIASRLADLVARGCDRILVVPLYPQYCAATTATVGDEVFRVLKTHALPAGAADRRRPITTTPPISTALASTTNAAIARLDFKPDVILASFHGIPKAYVDKGDPYYAQCLRDHAAAARALGLDENEIAAHVPVALRPRAMARARDRPAPSSGSPRRA